MSIGQNVFKSSSLLIGIKFSHRLIGLISILILARLLVPEDFAMVALVSMTIHFFDILGNVGSEQYIIQKEQVSNDDLNSAFTIDLIIKTLLFLALVLASPWAADFFRQPDLEFALYAASSVLLINALKNPGIYLLKQNFDYTAFFWLSVVQKIVSFIIAITIAVEFRTYWALIIADIAASVVMTMGTYFIHAHRPTFCLKNFKPQWDFSQWLVLKGVVGYTRSQIDTFLVSRFFPAAQLGQYYMARDIAMIPSHNLMQPAIEPLLAAFKHTRNDQTNLETNINLSLWVVATLTIPLAIFVWFFSAPIIHVLLGDKWLPAHPLLAVMSLLFLYFSFIQVAEQVLLALTKTKALFIYDLFSLVLISAVLFYFTYLELSEFALMRGLLGIFTTLIIYLYLARFIKVMNIRLVFYIAILSILGLGTGSILISAFEQMAIPVLIELVCVTLIYFSFIGVVLYLATKIMKIKELNELLLFIPLERFKG